MAKYITTPMIIEAMQFDRNNFNELVEFTNGKASNLTIEKRLDGRAWCYIDLTGSPVYEGDYVIKDSFGSLSINFADKIIRFDAVNE
jgi:hypothetical protein